MRKVYDAYKKNGCPMIQVVNERTGNDMFVYDPAEKKDYMEKSDKTDRPLRWVVVVDDVKMSLQDAFGVRGSGKNSELKVIAKMSRDELLQICEAIDFSLWNSFDAFAKDVREGAESVDSMIYNLFMCAKSTGVLLACADAYFNS